MKHVLIAGVATLALLSGAASARDIPAGGLTLEQVQAWLQGAGYKAEIQTNSSGERNIYSAAEGTGFHIYMYDCKKGLCGSMEFSVGFNTKGSFNAAQMNTWNKKNRWVRAYIDDVNDPWLEYDIDLTPGGTYELLNDQFTIWRGQLKKFADLANGS